MNYLSQNKLKEWREANTPRECPIFKIKLKKKFRRMSADQQYNQVMFIIIKTILSKQYISTIASEKEVYEYRTSVAMTRMRKNEI